MRKLLAFVLIISLFAQLMVPTLVASAEKNVEQVQASDGVIPSKDIVTIEWLSQIYNITETSLLNELNKGYSLNEIRSALEMSTTESLPQILNQINPDVDEHLKLNDYSVERFEEKPPVSPTVDPSVTSSTYGNFVETTGDSIFPNEDLFINPSVTSSTYSQPQMLLAASTTYPTSYDELAVKRMDIKTDIAPYSISSADESISSINGSLSLQSTDIELPGRNGMSFSLTRKYSSDDSRYYDKDIFSGTIYTTRYYPELVSRLFFKYSDYQSVSPYGSASNFNMLPSGYQSFVQYMGDYTYWFYPTQYPIIEEFNNEVRNSLASSWKYVDPDDKNSPVFMANENIILKGVPLIARAYTTGNVVQDPFVESKYRGTAYANKIKEIDEKRFPIGKGWSWDIPYIETNNNGKKYIHLFGGSSYEMNGLFLKGYPWKDISLSYDNSVTVNGLVSSLLVKSIDGQKMYFSGDGRLIQISDTQDPARDNNNNKIQFEYQNVTPYGNVLVKIKDSINNEINITYTTTDVTITSGDRTVKYDKIKDPQGNKELLSQVTDAAGRKTQYVYEIASTPFDLVGYGRMQENYAALLKQVYHPTKARTEYTYETFTRSLGYSAKEIVRRVSSREDIITFSDGSESKSNRVDYRYTGDGAAFQQSNLAFSTTVDNGRIPTIYSYDRVYIDDATPEVFYNTEIRKSDGTQTSIVTMEYDRIKRLPSPIKITSKTILGSSQSTESIITRTYDDYRNVTTKSDPLGNITTYTYDPSSHLLKSILSPVRNGLSLFIELDRDNKRSSSQNIIEIRMKENGASGVLKAQVNYFYDSYGNRTKSIFKDDNSSNIDVWHQYTNDGGFLKSQFVSVNDINGVTSNIVQRYNFNPVTGELIQYTDGKGYKTQYEYDKLGRPTRITYDDQSSYVIYYDDQNNQMTTTDETGVKTITKWDPIGNMLSKGIDGKGALKYNYDNHGRLLWSEDELGIAHRTSYTYDKWDRLIRTDYPGSANAFSTLLYDDINRVVLSTDPEGNTTREEADVLGRIIHRQSFNSSNALMSSANYTYDYIDNNLSITDGNGNTTSYVYDVLSRLLSVTDPELNTTNYSYGLSGNLLQVENPDHTKVIKQYDELGRLIQETDPHGRTEKFFYDENSNLTKTIDHKGQTKTYNYSKRNLLISSITTNETITYVYDAAGKRLQMQDSTGSTMYAYEPASGWLRMVTYPDSRQTQYEYDSQGHRIKMIDPFGITTFYKYDAQDRLESVGTTENNLDVTYQYKKNGLISKAILGNGINSTFNYNELNLNSLTHVKAGGATLNNYSYAFDLNRNQSSKTDNGIVSDFTYDKLNRVSTSTQNNEKYFYDNRGNRQIFQSTKPVAFVGATYQYDDQNRLTQATISEGGTVTYRYNGDGLLVERTDEGNTNRYYYDGDNIIAEGTVTNGVSTHKASYIRGNELISRVDATGNKAYYVHNGHGDVVGLVDTAGNSLNTYTYDIWGNPLTTIETISNPFRYSGEYSDNKTGLQYLRARWYDPSIGRFINKDTYEGTLTNPLSQNLYTYVGNNPLKYIDPSGHIIVMPDLNGIFNAAVKEVKDTLKWAEEENAKMSDFSWYYKLMYGDTIDSLFNPSYEDAFGIGGLRGPGKKGKIEIPIKPNSIADNIKELSKIASKYGNCQCVDAAKNMKSFILKNGLKGEQVSIKYDKSGFIVSDSYKDSREFISSNGFHTGILYEGKVYDNIHPNGISYQKWLDDFHGVGQRTITKEVIK